MRRHRYGAAVTVLAAALAAAACGSTDSDSSDAERGTTAAVATESAAETAPQHGPSPGDADTTSAPSHVPDADAPPPAPQPGPAGPDTGAPGPGEPGDPAGYTVPEQAYLAERESIPAPSAQEALDEGYAVCAAIADGSDYLTVRRKVRHAGSEVEIGWVVNAAAENLCPDLGGRLNEIIRERD